MKKVQKDQKILKTIQITKNKILKLKTHAKATRHQKEQKVQISQEITSKPEKKPYK